MKPNSSTIAELIRDDGDEHTLKIGSKLPLGKGYSLEAKQVDVNGEKVWLELDKEGGYVDENIISTDGDATWNCKLDNIQGENKVPVLRVHIKQISLDAENNDITIDGLWLIDYANASSYTG